MNDPAGQGEAFERGRDPVPAATIAAQRVAAVRDRPLGRLQLLTASYAPPPGAPPLHRRYPRAAIAFMDWQLRRGLLNPPDRERPGSPWWLAVNERLLRDTCEARSRVLGHPGPASSSSVDPSVRFSLVIRRRARGIWPTTSRSSARTSTTARWRNARTGSSASSSTWF